MEKNTVYKIDGNDFVRVELGQNLYGIKRRVFVLVDVRDKIDLDMMLNKHAQVEAENMVAAKLDAALLDMTKRFLNINPHESK